MIERSIEDDLRKRRVGDGGRIIGKEEIRLHQIEHGQGSASVYIHTHYIAEGRDREVGCRRYSLIPVASRVCGGSPG